MREIVKISNIIFVSILSCNVLKMIHVFYPIYLNCVSSNELWSVKKKHSPAYKNGSILTSIKIGNIFLTLQAVIQSASVKRRLLARFCGLLSLFDDTLCCCCKFSLSFSTRETFGQLWCSKKLFLLFWKFSSLRDLAIDTFSLHFHRCFCDLLHLFVSNRHFSLMNVEDFCVMHFSIDLFSILLNWELIDWVCGLVGAIMMTVCPV